MTVVPLRDMALLPRSIALCRGTSAGFGAVDAVSAVFGGGHAGYDTGGEAFSQVASGSTDDARALAATRDYEEVRLSGFRETTRKSRPTELVAWPPAAPHATKRPGSTAGLCISPALNTWAGKQTAEEACVAKERRMAREERTLARKPAKKGALGKAEGD